MLQGSSLPNLKKMGGDAYEYLRSFSIVNSVRNISCCIAIRRNYVKLDRSEVYAQVQQIHNLDSLRQWFEVLYGDVNEKMVKS